MGFPYFNHLDSQIQGFQIKCSKVRISRQVSLKMSLHPMAKIRLIINESSLDATPSKMPKPNRTQASRLKLRKLWISCR